MKISLGTSYESIISLFISLSFICKIESIKISQIGDSFSAGNGAGSYNDYYCFNSRYSWGSLAANDLGAVYENQACSGADLYAIESQADEAIDDCTDIVLLSSGTAELGFEDIVLSCFIPSYQDRTQCVNHISYVRSILSSYTEDLQQALVNLHEETRNDTKIVLVGYPHITLDVEYTEDCCGFSGNNMDIVSDIRALWDEIEDAQQNAIDGAHELLSECVNSTTSNSTSNSTSDNSTVVENCTDIDEFAYFFSTKALFSGHEPHPMTEVENTDGWLHEWSCDLEYEENYALNPNGHMELANAITSYLQDMIDDGIVDSPLECPDEVTPLPTLYPTSDPTGWDYYYNYDDDWGCCDDYWFKGSSSSFLKFIQKKLLL